MKLLCATSNSMKFGLGQQMCRRHDIELEQIVVEIDEIQGEDAELILQHKARAVFERLQRPVIVTDDSWRIPALNGFPGPYMKSMNHWFTPDDFLRLMNGISDRSIVLEQRIAYIDEAELVTFEHDTQGKLAQKPSGNSDIPITRLVQLGIDDGLTMAEVYERGLEHQPIRIDNMSVAWLEFAKWYKIR